MLDKCLEKDNYTEILLSQTIYKLIHYSQTLKSLFSTCFENPKQHQIFPKNVLSLSWKNNKLG